jgi:hypothetical protein
VFVRQEVIGSWR